MQQAMLPIEGALGGVPGHILLRILLAVALGIFVYVLYRRLRLIRLGQPDPRWSGVKQRLDGLIKDGFIQVRQPRYLAAGILHMTIFWGFVILGLHTVNLLVGGMVPGFSFGFMRGPFGVFYHALKDIVELTTLVACVGALYRRIVVRPPRYAESHHLEALLVLGLIALLMITDFYYVGSRIRLAPTDHHLLPGAWLAARTMASLSPGSVSGVHVASYWLHVLLLLFFLNLLPLSKHFHIITALPNVFFRKPLRGPLKPVTYRPIALDAMDNAGICTMADFTWKQILDLFSCTECGRCTDRCPVNRIGRNLSPKGITMCLRDAGYRSVPLIGRSNETDPPPVAGGVVAGEELWNCTTCGACEAECPVFVEHVDKIVDMRRQQVLMKSDFPAEFKGVFNRLEVYGDTMGRGRLYREDWVSTLAIKRVYEDGPADLLLWTGCMGPLYDEQSKDALRAAAKVLNRCGLDWGILGNAETCCGDWARRVGNEVLFEQLAAENIATFNTYGIRKIVTACPHCYNTFKHEYARLGADIEVLHITELIEQQQQRGAISIDDDRSARYTYHDPCYLGRYNDIYDAPREILQSACGGPLVEMRDNRSRGFCCGAGGGNFWRGGGAGQRMEMVRVEAALETGADGIVTACPYCKIMLTSGVKQMGCEHSFKVLDICEVIE